MSQLRWSCALTFLGALSLFGLSCSKSTEGLNPVQGKILFKGEPLGGALVSFHPEGNINGDRPTGFTKPDGTFSVTTGQLDGAAAGKYKLTFICSETPKAVGGGLSTGGIETVDKLQGAYANLNSSQISVTIKDGPNQLEPIDLK